ncbi:MAG: ABC transporter permease [Deltaproteobacteria bacterium]
MLRVIQENQYVLENFIKRDLKVKYRGTLLGYLWSLLEPLSLVGIYYFLFDVIARVDEPGYALIVILGVLPYNLFGAIVQAGAVSLTSNASLIRRVYIPREVFVYAHVGSNLVVFGLSMFAVVPFLFVYEAVPGWRIIFFPIAALLITLFATGIAFFVACVNALYRDVGYVIRVTLRLLFYGSPLIYPITRVPEEILGVYLLNPLSIYISLGRSAVMNEPYAFSDLYMAYGVGIAILTFVGGALYFKKYEKKAVKFL